MNRRELARDGFLGLCAAVLGKKAEKPAELSEMTSTTYITTGKGKWKRIEGTMVFPIPECEARDYGTC